MNISLSLLLVKSGMSISGLARACDVDKSTVSRLLQGLLQSSPSEILKPFAGKTCKELTLLHNSKYHNATILKGRCLCCYP